MREIENDGICPYCGDASKNLFDPSCIKAGLTLQNRYLVGEYVDKNSEGIGYIGYDMLEESVIYIREFMPKKFCTRMKDGIKIEIIPSCQKFYQNYLERFLNMARSIARFRDLASINPLYDIFEENNTVYYVTDFVRGRSLEDFMKKKSRGMSWDEARQLFMPLLSALEVMHGAGLMHLGIAPKNLIITSDGRLKLCGFSIPEVRQSNAIIEPELFDGYSAPEQYVIREKITESTDVYGFCACLMFALTGKKLTAATKRALNSRVMASNKMVLKDVSPKVVTAISDGLNMLMDERTKSFDDLRKELSSIKELVNEDIGQRNVKNVSRRKFYVITGCCFFVVAISVAVAIFCVSNGTKRSEADPVDSSSSFVDSTTTEKASAEKSQAQVVVPDLSGVTLKDAQKAAASNGDYEVLLSEEEFSDVIVAGRIISQLPAAGTQIKRGSVVVVNVSKGQKMRSLPEIKGLTISAASSKISSSGLVPKKEEAFSDTVPKGLIVGYKEHKVGDVLEYGTEVTIIVSKGKDADELVRK